MLQVNPRMLRDQVRTGQNALRTSSGVIWRARMSKKSGQKIMRPNKKAERLAALCLLR
ncbi:MAG: hypothetical protein JO239_07150 [Paraburkholderia sp.]|nr:hypothetical protein [Paraburkholderia sp.]